uniref:Reverse transcriptase zinc-binding domain-containing protein n=1 Tax=Triticum urartu TaxID=4572 RepID=A0A8R7Q3G0_TRIUA
MARSGNGLGQSSNWPEEEKLWKAPWRVKAPNKMKIVLWRLAHDCLPSGEQLRHRHVPTWTDCFFCGGLESVEHALLFCPHACAVWESVKETFEIKLCRSSFASPKQWLFDYLSRCFDREATVMTVTIWHIWEARNTARNEPEAPHP